MVSSKNKKPLKGIKSGVFSRGLALAKVSVSVSARAATHAVGNLFASETEKTERLKELLTTQIAALSQELGQLKGSLMKVGQMISMYGEHFLPPEANAILKSLQSQSPPLEWMAIEKVIQKQLSPEQLKTIEIDHEPMASASLGQVHRARRKSDGKWLAMKIQYPGVDRAIEGDLSALRSIFSIAKFIPKGPQYEEIFKEIRQMLHQEVDYLKEQETTREFKKALSQDPRFIVPEVIPELSTRRILTSTLEEGSPVDSPEVLGLSQERRNQIGLTALELYFNEVFRWGAVQTDPHFGNYRVRISDQDQLVLYDFGAVRRFSKTFLNSYLKFVRGAFDRQPELILKGAMELDFLKESDSEEAKNLFVNLSYLILEPFSLPNTPGVLPDFFNADGSYRWGESDLPKRAAAMGAQLAFALKFRSPPREVVFLDRKMGGMFIFLSVLKVQIQTRDLLSRYIDKF